MHAAQLAATVTAKPVCIPRSYHRRLCLRSRLPVYTLASLCRYNDDTSYSAAFILFQNYVLDGVVDMLSFWPFSDIFEEGGLYPIPFDRQGLAVDGLMNVWGIPKPSYRAFQLLAWSGNASVDVQPGFLSHPTVGVFATVGASGSGAAGSGPSGNASAAVFITNWNVKNQPISDYNITIQVLGASPSASASLYRIDDVNGNAYNAWQAMGSPLYPSLAQVAALTNASLMVPVQLPLAPLAGGAGVSFSTFIGSNTVVAVFLS